MEWGMRWCAVADGIGCGEELVDWEMVRAGRVRVWEGRLVGEGKWEATGIENARCVNT